MDIAEFLSKIRAGMTTEEDADWLEGYIEKNRQAAQAVLDVIAELGEFRFSALTFGKPKQAQDAITALKEALKKPSPQESPEVD